MTGLRFLCTSKVLSLLLLLVFQSVKIGCAHPCTSGETCGTMYSTDYLHDVYYSGLRRVSSKATTLKCKQRIEYEFMKHFRALAEESAYPFENIQYHSQCSNVSSAHPPMQPIPSKIVHLGKDDNLKLLPSVQRSLDPSNLSILYIMLVHSHPEFALRIINALDEPMHHFVIHVDATAQPVQEALELSLQNRSNIHLLTEGRETISWGGFSIVNATLTAMKYAWQKNISFDYLMDISGTTYPLKSNAFIRQTLAASPNAVFMETYAQPVKPEVPMWHQFVECDGALHRIARMPHLRGINMHVSSQWFAVPRHYVHWLLHSKLARDYVHYAQYIIIADENYFATMFFNSPYCTAELNKSLLFLLFDKWEHERNTTETGKARDLRKCLGVGPNACGRSPTTLTMEFKHLVSSSRALFARKFDAEHPSSVALADFIDTMRNTHGNTPEAVVQRWDSKKDNSSVSTMIKVGNDHLLPKKEKEPPLVDAAVVVSDSVASVLSSTATAASTNPANTVVKADKGVPSVWEMYHKQGFQVPLEEKAGPRDQPQAPATCLTVTTEGNKYVKMQPCDPGNPHQWFEIGRCTDGYELQLHDHTCPTFHQIMPNSSPNNGTSTSTTVATVSANNVTSNGASPSLQVFCSILTRSGDKSLCLDIAGENPAYETPLLGYDCTGRWNQLFHLGANCTIMAEQPAVVGRVRGKTDQSIVSCLDTSHKTGVLTTAECAHLKRPAGRKEVHSSMNTEVIIDGAAENSVSEKPLERKMFTRGQQFEFMPAAGNAFKEYMKR